MHWAVQVLLIPLTFCPASLKFLGCFEFYFRCVLSLQWKALTVNFTLPTLKTFFEAHSQNVSGNKQELVSWAIGCPQTHFFHKLAIFWSAKKQRKDTFFHPPSHFPCNFCSCNSSILLILTNTIGNFSVWYQFTTDIFLVWYIISLL